MVDYKKFENDDNFMAILNYLRCESLKEPDEQGRRSRFAQQNSEHDEWEVSETLDIDIEVVNKYFRLAQAVVAEEIANGETTNYDSDIALGFMDYIDKI